MNSEAVKTVRKTTFIETLKLLKIGFTEILNGHTFGFESSRFVLSAKECFMPKCEVSSWESPRNFSLEHDGIGIILDILEIK